MAVLVAGYFTNQRQTPPPSLAPSSILSRLRMETRDDHNAVEQALDLMSTSLTRNGTATVDDIGVMWHGMRELLVKSAPDTDTQDAMVISAIATISGLRRWCESSQKQ